MLYLGVVAAPMLVVVATGGGHRQWMMQASAAAGMAAGATILMQSITSGRFEAVSGQIGIDVTMAFHKWAAPVALLLAMTHVALLIGPPDANRPQRFSRRLEMVITGDGLWDARIALLLLLLVVLLALLRDRLPVRYETWRASHALAAVGLVAALLSHIIGDGTSGGVTGVWWVLALGFTLPAIWVYANRLIRPAAHDWRIVENRKVADRLWCLKLDNPAGRKLPFRAGQFAWAAFGARRFPVHDHPLSIASPPEDDRLTFLVQEAGDFTRTIGTLAPGTPVALDAPHGSFGLQFANGPILLIAGGVGIAPILSVLWHLANTGIARPVRFIYAARTAAAMVPADMFAHACEPLNTNPILLVDHGAKAAGLQQGPVTEEHLTQALRGIDPAKVEVLICGPAPMMTFACDVLARLGVPLPRIDYERFSYSTRDLSGKDRRMLVRFGSVWSAVAAMIFAYCLS